MKTGLDCLMSLVEQSRMTVRFIPGLFFFALFSASCGESENLLPEADGVKQSASPVDGPAAHAPVDPPIWSEIKLHEVIREKNPGYSGNGQFQIDEGGQIQAIALDKCGVTDLSPLQGMPLKVLYLLSCPVPDITALKGMPLEELYLENSAVKDLRPLSAAISLKKLYLSGTVVSDLSPLKGLGIVEMNLVNTRVADLSPLEGMPLQMLWLTDSPVTNITPLAQSPLVSLTLHRTSVSDLSPLAGTQLQRLHIGETPVTDLSPLKGMRLTRLVFDPDRIQSGFDVVAAMPTLTEVGTKFDDGNNDLQSLADFLQSHKRKASGQSVVE